MTNPVILVPYRPDGGRRDRLWAWCATFWSQAGWPIYTGIDRSSGPFNRAAAINAAARQAGPWSTAVIIDADTVAPVYRVQAAALEAEKHDGLTLPYTQGHRMMLTEEQTDTILEADPLDRRVVDEPRWRNHSDPDPYQGFRSGVVICPRPLWNRVDGFDEGFVGWGGEDDAFADACDALGGPMTRLPGAVWHLWHPEARPKRRTPELRRNQRRAAQYARAAKNGPAAMDRLLDTTARQATRRNP